MSDTVPVSPQLPRHLRHAVQDFREYVLSGYRTRHWDWRTGRILIRSVADAVLDSIAASGPPINPCLVATLLRVDVTITPSRDARLMGRLIPKENGFAATIYAEPSEVPIGALGARSRFTLAHECAHVLFFDTAGPRPQPLRRAGRGDTKLIEEQLCHDFARALLMPHRALDLANLGSPNLVDLVKMSRRFIVSEEVVLRRILYDLGGWGEGAFYKITPNGRSHVVRPFYGRCRKKRRKSYPTAQSIEGALEGVSFADIGAVLSERFDVEGDAVLARSRSAWLCL